MQGVSVVVPKVTLNTPSENLLPPFSLFHLLTPRALAEEGKALGGFTGNGGGVVEGMKRLEYCRKDGWWDKGGWMRKLMTQGKIKCFEMCNLFVPVS